MKLPSLQDLSELDAGYLEKNFRPWDQGIIPAELAAAFRTLPNDLRERLESKLSESCRRFIRQEAYPYRDVDADAAALRVLAIYFWEIVYQRFPEEYACFSACQEFPFADLFPDRLLLGRRVVDVAAGSGKLTLYVAERAANVIAIDPSAPLLDILARSSAHLSNIRCEQGSFAALPLPNNSVDLVVSNMGFQVNEERGGENGLREMHRVVRPGGEIRLVVGSVMTESWLRKRGFREKATHKPILWKLPTRDSLSPLLRILLGSVGVPVIPGSTLPDRWLFAQRRPSMARFVACVAGVFMGSRPWEVFDRGLPWRPTGCSVMVFRT